MSLLYILWLRVLKSWIIWHLYLTRHLALKLFDHFHETVPELDVLRHRNKEIGTDGALRAIEEMVQVLSEDQWSSFANTAWVIWRCRSEMAYKGFTPAREKFSRYFSQIN